MNEFNWKQHQIMVGDAMLEHLRPFGTTLTYEDDDSVRLIGSGAFVQVGRKRIILTCDHVVRDGGKIYVFHGSSYPIHHLGSVIRDVDLDIAYLPIDKAAWNAVEHKAQAIPITRFAINHEPVNEHEILFFRGHAGENATFTYGQHRTIGTGYSAAEKLNVDGDDPKIFEMSWTPEIELSPNSNPEATSIIRLEYPPGFSGSLVWNTRYVEALQAGRTWSPEDAVVTGLVRRWDPKTQSLLALRIEYVRQWFKI